VPGRIGAGASAWPYPAEMPSTVSIGMVGAGAVAARHVRTLLALDGVRVAAVADPALERARRLAELAGAAAYPNHLELLERERLDAVYICVPPFAHGAPELAAIDAGLPFFVEKPVAIDLETAAEIAARLAERPRVTCTGYHWRWLDIFERAAGLLADNPARLVQCFWLDKVPPPPWWRRRDGSGGQTIEQTTHVLDAARGLAGEVDEVQAFAARGMRETRTSRDEVQAFATRGARENLDEVQASAARGARANRTSRSEAPRRGSVADGGVGRVRLSTAPAGDVDDVAGDIDDVSVGTLRFAGGALGTVASTCLLPRLHRAGLHVVADGMSLDLSETELVVEADGERSVWPADGDARPRPDRDFVAAVRGGPDEIRVPWPEAYRTHRLAWALTHSAENGGGRLRPDGRNGDG
jgi:myo-inositol 2-dehydrogenase / D-chiro-inositol 1-dehydrogenase